MQQFLSDTIWLSDGLCLLRLIGDLCLVASAPWLLFKIRKSGVAGISVETQILRLIVFVTRYLDLLLYNRTISIYNTCMKVAVVVTSLHVVTSLVFRHGAYTAVDFMCGIYRLCLPLLFAMPMAGTFTYAYTFSEISWAFSQYLSSVADIPQILLLLNPENHDWRMAVYVGLVAGHRAFQIPHWTLRYLQLGVWDPIAVFSGIVASITYLGAFVTVLWKRYRFGRSLTRSLEGGTPKVEPVPFPSSPVDDLNSFPQEKL